MALSSKVWEKQPGLRGQRLKVLPSGVLAEVVHTQGLEGTGENEIFRTNFIQEIRKSLPCLWFSSGILHENQPDSRHQCAKNKTWVVNKLIWNWFLKLQHLTRKWDWHRLNEMRKEAIVYQESSHSKRQTSKLNGRGGTKHNMKMKNATVWIESHVAKRKKRWCKKTDMMRHCEPWYSRKYGITFRCKRRPFFVVVSLSTMSQLIHCALRCWQCELVLNNG